MKAYSVLALLIWLVASAQAAEDIVIKPGQSIDDIKKQMTDYKYEETGLEMVANDKGFDLAFWKVGDGTLIFCYSIETKLVASITYWFCDERGKKDRKTFNLDVIEFYPKKAEMKIKCLTSR